MDILSIATWLGRIGLGCIVLTFWWPVMAYFGMVFGVIGLTLAASVLFRPKKADDAIVRYASRALLLGGAAVLLGFLTLAL